MSQYFNVFPNINYNNVTAKNITMRAGILDTFKNTATNFYAYTISDGQTADSIAYDYYGDPNYVWIIYYCNDILDPYYDWPLDTVDFEKFLNKKYGSLAASKETIVFYKKKPVDYYVNDLSNEYILASEYNPVVSGYGWSKITLDDDIRISSAVAVDPAVWSEVDAYTYESEVNNNKRFIKLLDVSLIASVEKQFREIMNG